MNEKHVLGVLERFCVTLKNNICKTLLALKNPLPSLLPYPLPPHFQEWVKPFQYPVTMAIFHICLSLTLAMIFPLQYNTPLHYAARNCDTEMIQVLLDLKAKFVKVLVFVNVSLMPALFVLLCFTCLLLCCCRETHKMLIFSGLMNAVKIR